MGKFPEPDLLVAQWKEPLTDEIREGSSWRALMNGDVDLVIRWREFFYPAVNRGLGAPDTDTQRLALRGVLVDSGYARARSRAFLKKGIHYKDSRSVEERRALAAKWNAGWADIADVTREHLANVAVHECTISSLARTSNGIEKTRNGTPCASPSELTARHPNVAVVLPRCFPSRFRGRT
jgi:hypothetical protein